MSVAGRNLMKAVTGVCVGLGIGAAISSFVRRTNQPVEERRPLSESVLGWKQNQQQSWNEYWTYLKAAGEQARIEKEEEMRARFREKVNDQQAFEPKDDDTPAAASMSDASA